MLSMSLSTSLIRTIAMHKHDMLSSVSRAPQDPATIFRMVQKCGPQIFACVNDPDCKAALDCLQACDPTDQVPMHTGVTWCTCRRILKGAAHLLPFVKCSHCFLSCRCARISAS